MTTHRSGASVTRRTALAGLGAGGLGLALGATARSGAAQDVASEMAGHPVVGLWQYDGGFGPPQGGRDWAFEIYHADGTYVTWGGLNVGTALGIWRPTGARTAEVLLIYQDTDPVPTGTEGPGTATFHFDLEVDETDTTMTVSGGTFDVRDPHGTLVFPAGPFERGISTRVTFDHNPMTGRTVTEGTPEAGTPTS